MKKSKGWKLNNACTSMNSTERLSKLKTFCNQNIPQPLTIAQYRMLHCDSYSKQLQKLTMNSNTLNEAFKNILPLAFYHLNCNLPFEDLLELINLENSVITSSNELFHVLFQNSQTHLQSMYIHHYSFSNPIPFYYPIIDSYSVKEIAQYTFCKQLWYSLTPHNAVLSFGLGSAANSPMGKSTLLDLIFELNFTESNSQNSCFHSGSIDLRLTKNFYPGSTCEKYFTDWAFFDCHAPTQMNIIRLLLKHVSIVLIHILECDLLKNVSKFEKELRSLNLRDKNIFILIRDTVGKGETYSGFDSNIYIQIKLPKLEEGLKKKKLFKQELKSVGRDIIQLANKIPKFTSESLEELIKSYNRDIWKEFEDTSKLINDIKETILKVKSERGINFEFLSYYPTFVELMKKKYQLSNEDQDEKSESLNTECNMCFKTLNNAQTSFTNETFIKIISDKDFILILWKLAQELHQLTNNLPEGEEQANDKYSIEILWREAILNYKYNKFEFYPKDGYFDSLSRSVSKNVETGEPLELIDGDNLVFFSKEINNMLRHFHVKQTDFVQGYNKKARKITEAPLVLSIIGPQSSGKSTLLNYVFGCKFLTSSGRCTRGIYGSMMELSEPIGNSKFLFILDTEGIEATERKNISNAANIHFDRSLILFCLSVSNIVIINLPGEINTHMEELLKICAFSLNQLKVKRATLPKVIFVLNQTANPNLNNRKCALKTLINCLNNEIQDTKEPNKVKISDLIKLTEEDMFTLPSAFDIGSIDTPTYEIFNKRVVKQTPTLNFALECSFLKESIFEKLRLSSENDNLSFTSLSEWVDMAGVTWNAIITFQDIVKFKNIEELESHQKLRKFSEGLMEKYFYQKTQKKYFKEELDKHLDVIFYSDSLSSSQLKTEINKRTEDFIKDFNLIRADCLNEYTDTALKAVDSPLIKKEFKDQLERLISTELLNYQITLNNRTHEKYIERKNLECFDEFKNEITTNPERFVNLSSEELDREFEKLWTMKFERHDLEEIYRQQNLIDFYLSFTNDLRLIFKRELLEIYSRMEYDSEEVIKHFETKVLRFLTTLENTEKSYFYLAKQSTPLKDIQPHFNSTSLEYVSEKKFYYVHSTEGQESEYIKYFPNNKVIFKQKWVPEECIPILQSCSGYYPNYDINWGNLTPDKQVNKLVKSLLSQQMIPIYTYRKEDESDIKNTPKFFRDMFSDVEKLMKIDPEINPPTIKLIAAALQRRIQIFNHEISHIGAQLSIFAHEDIGSYIFSLAFRSYYKKKWELYLKNHEEIRKEKKNLKNYFTSKVEISKIIITNKESITSISGEYDSKFSEKYAKALLKILTEKVMHSLLFITGECLDNKRYLFDYESLLSEAENMVQKAIAEGEKRDRNLTNFVVYLFTDRNKALSVIFEKRWKEFIELNRETIITEAISSQQREINVLIEQLGNVLTFLGGYDKSLFYADKIFQNLNEQDQKFDSFQLNENPFHAMTLYLNKLMNPELSSNDIRKIRMSRHQNSNM